MIGHVVQQIRNFAEKICALALINIQNKAINLLGIDQELREYIEDKA